MPSYTREDIRDTQSDQEMVVFIDWEAGVGDNILGDWETAYEADTFTRFTSFPYKG